jgi:hypothetical protein
MIDLRFSTFRPVAALSVPPRALDHDSIVDGVADGSSIAVFRKPGKRHAGVPATAFLDPFRSAGLVLIYRIVISDARLQP